MTDERETPATMWQDRHSGKRGHQLMTEKLAETIPALYVNENVANYDTVLARAKLFSPYSQWAWYITEMNAATGTCFGLVYGLDTELGYFDLTELAETTVFGGVPAVERDLYWEPKTIGDIKGESQKHSPHSEVTRRKETSTDETGTQSHSQDVVNVEEFLFGGAADDASVEAEGEFPVGDAEEDVDAEAADEPDADTDTGDDAPDVAEDGGKQPAPAETENSEELKVVLSIKGGRATIGVQRSSADPHIESFEDPDPFRLADELPAVVARARAKWEEEPMHPAYVKPDPPAKRRNQRQQEPAAEAVTDEGEVEQQQPQPETLRLF